MNAEQRERGMKFRVGVFVLVALLAFLGMIYALGARARLFEARYTIHADFTEVAGLVEGATVRLAGVQIGRVTGVHLPAAPGGKVRVDLNITRHYADRIRRNSTARIETQGLLGDKIVEITVGTADASVVQAGEVIQARAPMDIAHVIGEGAETVRSVTRLADTLRQTAEALNQSKLIDDAAATLSSARRVTDQMERIVDEVEKGRGWGHALLYEEPVALRKLGDLLATTQALLDRVERGEGAVGVLTSPQSTAAAKRFVGAMDRLAQLADRPDGDEGILPSLLFDPAYKTVLDDLRVVAKNFRDVSDRLAGGRGVLGGLLLEEPDDGVRQAARDLQAAVTNLKLITEKINAGEGTLGALIADPTIYERLAAILDGAQRSFLLRSLIRNLGKERGAPTERQE
ncbi:MAG: MCE family protein [Candidatus Rokubacteria bacterium]|nr:MCE family protein [Candidatus Rokubacteria bacterium]